LNNDALHLHLLLFYVLRYCRGLFVLVENCSASHPACETIWNTNVTQLYSDLIAGTLSTDRLQSLCRFRFLCHQQFSACYIEIKQVHRTTNTIYSQRPAAEIYFGVFLLSFIPFSRLTDLDFADDIALVAEQAHVCQQMTAKLATHSVKLGLHISLEKTKIIQASQAATSQPIYLAQTALECVDQFTYLGGVISKDGNVEKEVNTRLAKAATVFRRLSNIWKSGYLGLNIKLQL